MMTTETLEKEILALPEGDRWKLFDRLSENCSDSEKEAMRRETEWDTDPSLGMTLDALKQSVGRG